MGQIHNQVEQGTGKTLNQGLGSPLPSGSPRIGDVSTQICGAVQAYLVGVGNELIKTGVSIIETGTRQANESTNSQCKMVGAAFTSGIAAGENASAQMIKQGIGEISSGVLTVGTVGVQAFVSSSSHTELETANQKLGQQQNLQAAVKPSTLGSIRVGDEGDQEMTEMSTDRIAANRTTLKGQEIEARKTHLLRTDGSRPSTYDGGNFSRTEEEEKAYNSTDGAYYHKGLDEAAIADMSPEERSQFNTKLLEEIRTTRAHISAVQGDVNSVSNTRQAIGQSLTSLTTGTSSALQAKEVADKAKNEATQTLNNQLANNAGGMVQNNEKLRDTGVNNLQSQLQALVNAMNQRG